MTIPAVSRVRVICGWSRSSPRPLRHARRTPRKGRGEPDLIVVLGATAGKALLGSSFRVTRVRGTVLEEEIHGRPERLVPTVHPSAVLRAEDREGAFRGLVSDLRVAAQELA